MKVVEELSKSIQISTINELQQVSHGLVNLVVILTLSGIIKTKILSQNYVLKGEISVIKISIFWFYSKGWSLKLCYMMYLMNCF